MIKMDRKKVRKQRRVCSKSKLKSPSRRKSLNIILCIVTVAGNIVRNTLNEKAILNLDSFIHSSINFTIFSFIERYLGQLNCNYFLIFHGIQYGHFPNLVRKYQSHYDSKKRGCAAQIRLKELMRFPAHKVLKQ